MNPTVMQSKGLDFLQPIWEMIYSKESIDQGDYVGENIWTWELFGLNLSEDDVEVSYTRYINHMKSTQNPKPNDKTIDEAVRAKLTPGNKR